MRTDRAIAVVLLAGVSAAAIALGASHRALLVSAPEASGSIEWDFYYSYVRDVQRLQQWQAPLDEWRGPLYPIILALLHLLVPAWSLFVLAKTVSAVSAGVAATAAFLLARRVLDRGWALLVTATSVATPLFVMQSILVGTDMIFAALCLTTTLWLVRALEGARAPAIAAGVLTGLALTMRWNAIFLLPAAICAVVVAGRAGTRRASVMTFVVAFAIAVAPWLLFNASLHGSPFFSRSNVNLSIAIYGNQSSVDSVRGALASAPGVVLRGWMTNVVHNGWSIAATLMPMIVLAPVGMAMAWRRRRSEDRALVALVAVLISLIAVNALGPFVPRQYLLAIPVMLTSAAAALQRLAASTGRRALVQASLVTLWLVMAAPIFARAVETTTTLKSVEAREIARSLPASTRLWPLLGDWNGDGRDGPAVVLDAGGSLMFYGFDEFAAGPANYIAAYGGSGVVPLAGRWRGGPFDSIGVTSAAAFFLKHAFFTGFADTTVAFGDGAWQALTGDWSGRGRTGLGRFGDGQVSLVDDALAPGAPIRFSFGGPGDVAITGDWNGDGAETLGLYRDGVFTLTNRLAPPFDDTWQIRTGISLAGALPLSGDRLGTGRDVPVLFLPDGVFVFFESSGQWRWRVDLGHLDDLPVAGR